MPWAFLALNLKHIGDKNLVNAALLRETLKEIHKKTILQDLGAFDNYTGDEVVDLIQARKSLAKEIEQKEESRINRQIEETMDQICCDLDEDEEFSFLKGPADNLAQKSTVHFSNEGEMLRLPKITQLLQAR